MENSKHPRNYSKDQSVLVKDLSYFCTENNELFIFFNRTLAEFKIEVIAANVWKNYKRGRKTLYCGQVVMRLEEDVERVISIMNRKRFMGRNIMLLPFKTNNKPKDVAIGEVYVKFETTDEFVVSVPPSI